MEIKWQKNAHILIKSNSGYLKVDYRHNIRRTCFLGKIWFEIKDYFSSGAESARLNTAVVKTLKEVALHLSNTQTELTQQLQELPNSRKILNFIDTENNLTKQTKITIAKIFESVQKLILKGAGGASFSFLPTYHYRTECLSELPKAISNHNQLDKNIKTNQTLENINTFFKLEFIQDADKRELVQQEIAKKSGIWTEFSGPSLVNFDHS